MFDLLLLIVVLAIPFLRTPLRVTSPFGYVALFVGFLFVGKFLYNQFLGADFLMSIPPAELSAAMRTLALFLLVAFGFALPFCATRRWFRRRQVQASEGPRPAAPEFTLSLLAKIVLLAVPLVLLAAGFAKGVNPIANPLGFRQLIQSQGMLYVLSAFLFLLGLVSIYVPYSFFVLKRRPGVDVLLLYVFSGAFALISGFASMIVQLVMTPLFFWSACYQKKVEVWLTVLVPFVVAFTLMYSAYRDANLAGAGIEISDAIDKVIENPELAQVAMNRFDYLEMLANGQRLLKDKDADWGASMASVVLQPIPRAIWPDKPTTFSTYMTQQILPQNFDIGVTANFNALNEFTQAFGPAAIVAGGLVLAAILCVAYGVFAAAAQRPYIAVYYVTVVLAYISAGFMAGFVNDIGLPLLLLNHVWFVLFVRRGGRAVSPVADASLLRLSP